MPDLDHDLLDSYFDLCLEDSHEDNPHLLRAAIGEAASLYAERIVGDLSRSNWMLYDLLTDTDEATVGEAVRETILSNYEGTAEHGLDLVQVVYLVLWTQAHTALTRRVETVRGVL